MRTKSRQELFTVVIYIVQTPEFNSVDIYIEPFSCVPFVPRSCVFRAEPGRIQAFADSRTRAAIGDRTVGVVQDCDRVRDVVAAEGLY